MAVRQLTEHKSFERAEEAREFPHGRVDILAVEGTELLAGPGQAQLPSGRDAWVVRGDPVVAVDFYGAGGYAKEGAR